MSDYIFVHHQDNYRYRWLVFGDGLKNEYNHRGYWSADRESGHWHSSSGFIVCRSYAHACRQYSRVSGGRVSQLEESPTMALKIRGYKRRTVLKKRNRPDMFMYKTYKWRI